MKNIIKYLISISINFIFLFICTMEINAQDWPCGNPAANNINIPGDFNVHLGENSVAIHPLYPNIVLSANNHYDPDRISVYVSTNWGYTWYSPYWHGIFESIFCCDPAAAIDLNGFMYVAYVNGAQTFIARSTNLGSNWEKFLIYSSTWADKEHLKVDNSCNSPYKGRLYCAWQNVNYQISVSYSTNQGTSWHPSYQLPNSGGTGVNIATDNSGNVYLISTDCVGQSSWQVVKFYKSTNGGDSWISVTSFQIPTVTYWTNGLPSMTVNMQDNTIYFVYSRLGTQYNDVFMRKSNNSGVNWSGEIRVNQVQNGTQTSPWLSCDPMTGYLACIYYDTRDGQGNHTYLSISTNSGDSWCDMKVSVTGNGAGIFAGQDYIGIDFCKGVVYPVWTAKVDNNNYTLTYPYEVIAKDLIIENKILNGNQLFQSANTITAYNVTINTGANVNLMTVKSITLLPGFYTNDNCVFIADLFHCQGYNEPGNLAQKNQVKLNGYDNTNSYEYSLSQNYPNPFNPTTTLKYSLKQNSWVTLIIYNILGQEVKKLVDGNEYAGYRSIVWDGTNNYGNQVSSGVYFCKLIAGDFVAQKKLVIIR
jgi:hypothetical protein